MIALALQIRILFIALVLGTAIYLLWRLGQRVAADPRLRATLSGPGARLLALYLLRRGLPVLLRLLRGLRFFR